MILRRLANAVREQNWFTVIIEFTLVVAGVLVALQLDNWNNERQTRLEEQRLVSQLLDELTFAIDAKRQWIAQTEVNNNALEEAIYIVQETDPDSRLSHKQCYAAWTSHIVVFAISRLATLDEILSTGGIRTLKDKNLRDTLLTFNEDRERTAANLAFTRSDFANLIDNYPDAFPRTLIDGSTDDANVVSIETDVACDLALIRANQEIRNKLISNLGRRTGALDSARSEVTAMDNLKERLSEQSHNSAPNS